MEERTYCLFLVDDNIVNLEVGKSVLQEKFSVLTILSGEKLFSAMKKARPDMILLDIEMPGMSGFDAIKELKAAPDTKDIPVIFLTGNTDPVSKGMGRSLGAVDYILKPYNPQQLLEKIDLYFRLQKRKLAAVGIKN